MVILPFGHCDALQHCNNVNIQPPILHFILWETYSRFVNGRSHFIFHKFQKHFYQNIQEFLNFTIDTSGKPQPYLVYGVEYKENATTAALIHHKDVHTILIYVGHLDIAFYSIYTIYDEYRSIDVKTEEHYSKLTIYCIQASSPPVLRLRVEAGKSAGEEGGLLTTSREDKLENGRQVILISDWSVTIILTSDWSVTIILTSDWSVTTILTSDW